MRRYLGPVIAYVVVVAAVFAMTAVLNAGWLGSATLAGVAPLLLLVVGYIAASVWWVVRASGAPGPLWPHLIAVWAPAILPVASLVGVVDRTREVDNAAMFFEVALYPAVLMVLVCGAGAIRLVLRFFERPAS